MVYADCACESEDDDWERKHIDSENEEITDFAKCHPMPSPGDEEGDKFWKKVVDN